MSGRILFGSSDQNDARYEDPTNHKAGNCGRGSPPYGAVKLGRVGTEEHFVSLCFWWSSLLAEAKIQIAAEGGTKCLTSLALLVI